MINKEVIEDAVRDGRMNHGTATLKENLVDGNGNNFRQIGEVGIITAYLPEDNKYAVMFDGKMGVGNWFTFDKVSFEQFFDYKLKEQ